MEKVDNMQEPMSGVSTDGNFKGKKEKEMAEIKNTNT